MELYQIDRGLRDLPNFYKMYSTYEMEKCISNEERCREIISRLKKVADKIDMSKVLAYLECDIEKGKVELDDKEFDTELLVGIVKETDEMLEGKATTRMENGEVNKSIDIRKR